MDPTAPLEGTILYIHVPKAAGSTLHAIFEKQYPPGSIYRLHGSVEELVAFQSLPEDKRKEIRFLSGHFPFGQHALLSVPYQYITVLREPVDLTVSYYHYVLRETQHYLHDEVVSKNIPLKDFVESGMCPGVLNPQTYLMAGIPNPQLEWSDPDYPLTVALENLKDRFSVIGLTERFPETLLLIKRALGWKSIPRFAVWEERLCEPSPVHVGARTACFRVPAPIEARLMSTAECGAPE